MSQQQKAWDELFQMAEELDQLFAAKGYALDSFETYCDGRVNLTVTGRWVVDYAGIVRDLRADQQDDIVELWFSNKTDWWRSRNLSARPVGVRSQWEAYRTEDGKLRVHRHAD